MQCFSCIFLEKFRENFSVERVVRPWQELPREVWRCHLGWGQGGDSLDLMLLEIFPKLSDPGIPGCPKWSSHPWGYSAGIKNIKSKPGNAFLSRAAQLLHPPMPG